LISRADLSLDQPAEQSGQNSLKELAEASCVPGNEKPKETLHTDAVGTAVRTACLPERQSKEHADKAVRAPGLLFAPFRGNVSVVKLGGT